MNRDELRKLPQTDEVLRSAQMSALLEKMPRELVVQALREEINGIRRDILQGDRLKAPGVPELIRGCEERLRQDPVRTLRRVVNATGVIIHTNLGRAVLSPAAVQKTAELAAGYSNLEYNTAEGARGSRHDHAASLVRFLTGAEDAMLVNNNAAAVLLALAVLSAGRETVLSRGELIEIGGSFRIPDIMECSGAILREVGTTNRTRVSDYEKAVGENTGLLMKVHPSNYRITGFTEEASLEQLSALAREKGLPLVYDLGSGLLTDLRPFGIDEPDIRYAIRQGADLVLCSGDKLLGGAQAGIVAGKRELIEKMKRHPLARAFRVDKLTLAAVEATLYAYTDTDRALREVPVLRMITESGDALRQRAEHLRGILEAGQAGAGGKPALLFAVEPVTDRIGGGAAPETVLPGWAVTVRGGDAAEIEKKLRGYEIPVIARVAEDRVWISVRTLLENEEDIIAGALAQ